MSAISSVNSWSSCCIGCNDFWYTITTISWSGCNYCWCSSSISMMISTYNGVFKYAEWLFCSKDQLLIWTCLNWSNSFDLCNLLEIAIGIQYFFNEKKNGFISQAMQQIGFMPKAKIFLINMLTCKYCKSAFSLHMKSRCNWRKKIYSCTEKSTWKLIISNVSIKWYDCFLLCIIDSVLQQ